jgi:putative transcription factor
MQCEICERYIEKGKRVRIEGSVVVTCDGCSRYGEVVGAAFSHEVVKPPQKVEEKTEVAFDLEVEALVEDYPELIRKKREKMDMKQEELARLINEPASLIHRIEIGKMEPSPQIARKLQQKLGVRLLQKSGDMDVHPMKSKTTEELTLGDLVVVKKKARRG